MISASRIDIEVEVDVPVASEDFLTLQYMYDNRSQMEGLVKQFPGETFVLKAMSPAYTDDEGTLRIGATLAMVEFGGEP